LKQIDCRIQTIVARLHQGSRQRLSLLSQSRFLFAGTLNRGERIFNLSKGVQRNFAILKCDLVSAGGGGIGLATQ
jgi:hypothetical protein